MVGAQLDLAAFYARNRQLGQTDRERDATLAELYHQGLQYAAQGLADWNDTSVPLRKRTPRIRLPLFALAVKRLDQFVWGGNRFPKAVVAVTRTEDDPEDSSEIGPRLDKEQAETLTKFVADLVKQGRLSRGIREAAVKALVTTSAAIIVGVRGGYVSYHVECGKHCTPTWSANNPRDLEQLEIVYQYEIEEPNGLGGVKKHWYWYRRTLTTTDDIVYLEVPVVPGVEPQWKRDETKSVAHRLGYVPARWIRTLPDSTDAIDGRPVVDPQLYSLLDDVNYVISQRSRAVSYGCDPQTVRKGVAEGDREDLKKTPVKTWDVPPEGDVTFLEVKGTGAEQASKHIDDLTLRFREAVGVVEHSPDMTVGNLSAVALELLHAPMIAIAGDLREDFGTEGFVGLLNLALRMVTDLTLRGQDVWVQGAAQAAKILTAAQLRGVWLEVPIELQWPPYFSPSVVDQQAMVDTANRAHQGGLVTGLSATRYVSSVFAIADADAEREAIEEEAAEQADYGPLTAPLKQEVPSPGKQPPVGAPVEGEPEEEDQP